MGVVKWFSKLFRYIPTRSLEGTASVAFGETGAILVLRIGTEADPYSF